MRFLPQIGLYKKGTADSLRSGISYTSQPTDIPLNALAVEHVGTGDDRIYQFVNLSGTCTVGSLLYFTGTALGYVVNTGTGAGKPAGVSLVAPTASGVWTWIQKYGKNTSIQVTNTFGGGVGSNTSTLFGGESAAVNFSAFATGISTTGGIHHLIYMGRSLTAAAASQTVGFLELL